MSLAIALHDVATNCGRDGATAVLTLRSGAVITGSLEKSLTDGTSVHMRTPGGGWVTVLTEEIAAVESRR